MYCKECNSQIPDEAAFCPNCGAVIEENDLEATGLLIEDEVAGDETGLLIENEVDNEATGLLVEEEQQQAYSLNNANANNNAGNTYNAAYVNPGYQNINQAQQSNYNQFAQQQNVNTQNAYQQVSSAAYQQINQSVQFNNQSQVDISDYENFYERFASKSTKGNTKAIGIICIITAVASLAFLALMGNPLSIIDMIFYGVFAGLILKKKKWQFTLPVCIYGGVFSVVGIVMSGTPSGILAFILSLLATKNLKKLDYAHKLYLSTNQVPQNEI